MISKNESIRPDKQKLKGFFKVLNCVTTFLQTLEGYGCREEGRDGMRCLVSGFNLSQTPQHIMVNGKFISVSSDIKLLKLPNFCACTDRKNLNIFFLISQMTEIIENYEYFVRISPIFFKAYC